ncbi:MAG: tetratricopeptide repeat protein [Lachnospiraceae bacterium]|nr:tetratricopeptide repeat protein [Lachnospiraceae bacterium]
MDKVVNNIKNKFYMEKITGGGIVNCKKCGESLKSDSKFCHRCGRKVNHFDMDKLKTFIEENKNEIKLVAVIVPVALCFFIIIDIIIPSYSRLKLAEGINYLKNEEYEKAVTAFSHAETAGAKDQALYTYMGEAYIKTEDYDEAEKALSNATKERDNPEALILLADVWEYEKNEKMLEETLLKLTELMPNDPRAYIRLSKFYAEKGRYENASEILEALLKRQENKEALQLLYNIYAQSYVKNKSLEKGGTIEEKALSYLKEADIKDLSLYEGEAISLSPKGKYLIARNYSEGREYINVLEKNDYGYSIKNSFKPPSGYQLSFDTIVFSPDESKIAFYNKEAEEYLSDSYIYIYEIENNELYNLTDPKEDYTLFLQDGGVFIIDRIPAFSEDGQRIYFSRHSSKGDGLYEVNLNDKVATKLYEPPAGGTIDYKIIEKNGLIYFSVKDEKGGGIYTYEDEKASRLNFEYDKAYYDLALWDMSMDGKYLIYYITIASQNNSFFFKVLDIDTMALIDIYPQDIAMIGNKFTSVNYYDTLGKLNTFICKNAVLSPDGERIVLAEENPETKEVFFREISIKTGNSYFLSILKPKGNPEAVSLAVGELKEENSGFKMLEDGKILFYDQGLKVLEQ